MWPRLGEAVSPSETFPAVPTATMAADERAEKHTWRRDVAPLEGCHTPITHAATEPIDNDFSNEYELQHSIQRITPQCN